MLEAHGIATCAFSQVEEISLLTRPPRLLVVEETVLGYPLGQPGEQQRQLALVRAAIEMLRETVPEQVWHRSGHENSRE